VGIVTVKPRKRPPRRLEKAIAIHRPAGEPRAFNARRCWTCSWFSPRDLWSRSPATWRARARSGEAPCEGRRDIDRRCEHIFETRARHRDVTIVSE